MRKSAIAAILALTMACPVVGHGQQPAAPAAVTDPKPAYVPGLAEYMLATQIRHMKLWFAGNAGNWDLADYEIDELKEGLEDAAKLVPIYKDMPVGRMIDTIVMAPIAEVEAAIKAKDRGKFAGSFDKLTAACNSCHQGTNRSFIVIQRPNVSAFPNQSFTPRK